MTTGEQSINLTRNLTIAQSLGITLGFFILSMLLFSCIEWTYWKDVRRKIRTLPPDQLASVKRPILTTIEQVILGSCMICSCIYLLCAGQMIRIARAHGMYQKYTDITWEQVIKGIHHTPEEDTWNASGEPAGTIILYYRFGCPDCESVYATEKNFFRYAPGKVVWISTRSEQGKKLIKQYPINEVPSGVYVKSANDSISFKLYQTRNNKPVFNAAAAETLINLQQNNMRQQEDTAQ